LFPQSVFTENLTSQFLTVLLQSLVSRSHDLLREEIVCTVHAMATADFDAFFRHFLPHFVAQDGQVDHNQAEILISNFKPDTVRIIPILICRHSF
jgi:histone acetyltransferase (RNA polymerase elongator complex component)